MELQATKFRTTRQGVRDLDQSPGNILPISGGPVPATLRIPNVGDGERALSAIAGGTLIGVGLGRLSVRGAFLALAGAALVYRGVSGKCEIYRALNMNTADASQRPNEMAYRV